MSERYVVASDLGSSGCKTVIMNTRGKVVSAAQKEYPTYYPHPGWVEQNPEDWYHSLCFSVRTALQQVDIDPKKILGLGIVGVTHNFVLLDGQGCVLCPSILIFDTRSTAQVQRIISKWGEAAVRERTLNDVNTVWSWPQLLWLRENKKKVWQSIRKILFQKDYVRNRLAPSPVTDYIDASGTLLFDPLKEEWISSYCEDLGLDINILPEVVAPTDIVGRVSREGAADTGLAAGTPVITGTTDTVAEVLGSGALREGSAIIKLASVGRIAVVAKHPVRRPHIFNYRHILNGLWYPGTASKYAASAYRWFKEILWPANNDTELYPEMNAEAEKAPPGSNGLLFHPHLMGQWAPYWNEQMRGDFLGLTDRHRRSHLIRAVLEGVAFSLKDALTQLEEIGLKAGDMRLIGQGSRSRLWGQIVANVINRPLYIPTEIDAAYGSALITAMGVQAIARNAEGIEKIITIKEMLKPDEIQACSYAVLYDIYRDADRAIMPIAARLHEFEHNRSLK